MTVMSLIGMGKQKQKRLQTAMVILFLASLSFMVGYWNGLIPNAGYTLMEESKKGLLKTSNIKDFKSKLWEDRSQKPLDDNSSESKPSAKIKPNNIRIIPIRKKKRPPSVNPVNKKPHMKKPSFPFPSSIFDFRSMTAPQNSSKHPFTYAKALMKTEMSWEFINNSDVKNMLMPRTKEEAPPLSSLNETLAKNPVAFNDILSVPAEDQLKLGDEISPGSAKKILIVTTWRSGSTFLGDLLNHYPGTWYSFEPLHYRNTNPHLNKDDDDFSLKLVSDIFKCQPERGYYKHANNQNNRFLFRHNFRFWNACKNLLMGESGCFMPVLTEKSCPLFPIRLIKLVRMRMKLARLLFDDPDIGPGLKIVFLVRDPRGVMNSRDSMDWCAKSSCNDPKVLCDNMHEDYLEAVDIKKQFPDKVHMVRYEDLCLYPFNQTDQILNFLSLPKRPIIEKYLEESTSSKRAEEMLLTAEHKRSKNKNENPYSTKRDSKVTVFAWRQKIKPSEVEEIQSVCSETLNELGYKSFEDIHRDLKDEDINVLEKTRVNLI